MTTRNPKTGKQYRYEVFTLQIREQALAKQIKRNAKREKTSQWRYLQALLKLGLKKEAELMKRAKNKRNNGKH